MRWLVLVWLVGGLAAGLVCAIHGYWLSASIGAFVSVMALGICFQNRTCAGILLACYAISAVVILIREVAVAHEWLRLGKVAVNVWFAVALARCLGSPDETPRRTTRPLH